MKQQKMRQVHSDGDEAGVVPLLTRRANGGLLGSGGGNEVLELVVVYDADGTVSGEFIYMTKKLLGLGHCAACDITHGPRKEKPEFTALKKRGWGVPLLNIHRNEMDHALAGALRTHLPCVGARLVDGTVRLLLDRDLLHACGGDVDAFRIAVDDALVDQALRVPPPPACALPPFVKPMNGDAMVPTASTH